MQSFQNHFENGRRAEEPGAKGMGFDNGATATRRAITIGVSR